MTTLKTPKDHQAKYQSVKLSQELLNQFREISNQTMIPISRLISQAMQQYILRNTRPGAFAMNTTKGGGKTTKTSE